MCTFFLFIGEVLIACVMGDMVTQIKIMERKKEERNNEVHYVMFSLNIHHLPDYFIKQVISYMRQVELAPITQPILYDFLEQLNPRLRIDTLNEIMINTLRQMPLFESVPCTEL